MSYQSTDSGMVRCQGCGEIVHSSWGTCPKCGTQLGNHGSHPGWIDDPDRPAQTQERSGTTKWKIATAISSAIALICAVAAIWSIVNRGPDRRNVEDARSSLLAVESQNAELTSELEKVTEERNAAQKELDELKAADSVPKQTENDGAESIDIEQDPVIVRLVDKQNKPMDFATGIYQNYILFTFEVKNNTGKDIHAIKGITIFKNLFGDDLISITLNIIGETIPAHSASVFDDFNYSPNLYLPIELQFYDTAFEDLRFEFELEQIVFEDGTMFP